MGSDAWAAKASNADWQEHAIRQSNVCCIAAKFNKNKKGKVQWQDSLHQENKLTFFGELKRSAYLVNAVLKEHGGKVGGKVLLPTGVPSSLSVWREK